MDNEAFRSIINKNRKSTKEIAREAVENDFKKRKRANRDDQGYGSDSDSDSGVPRNDKHGRGDGKSSTCDEVEGEHAKRGRREKKPEYRDRARERREGKSVDYALLDVGTSTQDGAVTAEDRKRQAELSKYLGGDEEHTHLVKGLDRVLAQKVRREEMGQREEDFDEMLESALEERRATDTVVTSGQGLQSIKPKSDLGKHILKYLLQKERKMMLHPSGPKAKVNPSLQKSIQRSILTFSLDSDVRRRKHAWDAPQMTIQAFSADDSVAMHEATPLDYQLIKSISSKLRGHLLRSKHGNVTVTTDVHRKTQDTLEDITTNNEKHARNVANDDSDDDIFENAGSYIPPSADTATERANESQAAADNEDSNESKESVKKKQSIFDNLITATEVTTQYRKIQMTQTQIPESKNVINRDVIGASEDQPIARRRGPQTAAMDGYSMSNYKGGYGEEMDVDFGNIDEDNRRKKKVKDDIRGNDGKEEEDENDF
jgi:hypothetical protein